MDQASQEVEGLGERVERILAVVRRLSDENAALRQKLEAGDDRNRELERRIAEARERVQAALARLPDATPAGSETAPEARADADDAAIAAGSEATAASEAPADAGTPPRADAGGGRERTAADGIHE